MLSGTISMFIIRRITLTAIIIRTHIQKALHNNNVPNMKNVRNKTDTFSRR